MDISVTLVDIKSEYDCEEVKSFLYYTLRFEYEGCQVRLCRGGKYRWNERNLWKREFIMKDITRIVKRYIKKEFTVPNSKEDLIKELKSKPITINIK